MDYQIYTLKFRQLAVDAGYSEQNIQKCLEYAKPLIEKKLPVIFNSANLAAFVGYKRSYIKRAAIFTPFFYRKFFIKKQNGQQRSISEPLPSLKEIQHWILNNILYNIEVSKFAKAYIPKRTLVDNLKFHRNKNVVLCVDVENFFSSIQYHHVFDIFSSVGYSDRVSTTLANLVCLDNCLPQGAPTSAYISNIFMRQFDDKISEYCIKHSLRYTRYADDITISGNFNAKNVLKYIAETLPGGLFLNHRKTRIMKRSSRQLVTGVVVNEKLQVKKEIRKELRKSLYYIEKYGLVDHLKYIDLTKANYLKHLIGLVNYVLFINPADEEAKKQKDFLKHLIENKQPPILYQKPLPKDLTK